MDSMDRRCDAELFFVHFENVENLPELHVCGARYVTSVVRDLKNANPSSIFMIWGIFHTHLEIAQQQ